MTMHLVGPWLTTTGRRRGKKKFRTAEQASTARKNQEAWQALLKKYDINKRDRREPLATSRLATDPVSVRRDTGPKIPSIDTWRGETVKTQSKQYTGTLIKGIATMHKSNAVPILDEEQARDVAHMRR